MHALTAAYGSSRVTVPGAPPVELAPDLAVPGFAMTFEANAEIFGEEESADYVYKVISGAVRTTRLLADGRRQIGGFHLPGDVFGFEHGHTHRFSAEAIEPSQIALASRAAIERAVDGDPHAAQALLTLVSDELEALQDHMLLLGRKNASERVGAFLLRLALRFTSGVIELPMSRGDIADHLGLTLETVSRTLSQMARDRVIALPSARRVILRQPVALAAA